MDIVMISPKYIDLLNKDLGGGGMLTYEKNLINIFVKNGYKVYVYNRSSEAFVNKEKNVQRIGMAYSLGDKSWYKRAVQNIEKQHNLEKDLFIIISNNMVMKNRFAKSLYIQHGISWDTDRIHGKQLPFPIDTICRLFVSIREIRINKKINRVVCVDYNYINWLRTQTTDRSIHYDVIPNFAEEIEEVKPNHDPSIINIVFARRFVRYRGIDIMKQMIPMILEKYTNVRFTLAGNEESGSSIADMFKGNDRVVITHYDSADSVRWHTMYDIAVVPTIGSEGTSLSLLEAMSAGCAVVCTDVGGMTNIVIDGYNGALAKPELMSIYQKICDLIENKDLREKYSQRARETIHGGFSRSIWEQRWMDLVHKIETES